MNDTGLAPVYRYYMVDLLSNQVLAEVPYRGVSYERAIKSAGAFRGTIPVIEDTESMSLYENTMPGNTALYAVRNGKCVWGGIVWSRTYNVVTKDLNISASEFTSYLYHRRVWKTWNHQFGATVIVTGGVANATFDNGSTSALSPGASVRLDFKEVSQFRYSGYYRIADTPNPTTDTFSIQDSTSIVTVDGGSRLDGVATIQTVGAHGFNPGDLITISAGGSAYDGTHTVTEVGGAGGNLFSFVQAGADSDITTLSGVATRPLPDGVYVGVTVSVRTDTYEYVRSLVGAVFKDFVGIDFPNVYIEPGISYGLQITGRELADGLATITTAEPHNLAVGQAVQVQDLDPLFDGEAEVLETRAENEFTYALGGTLAEESVAPRVAVISEIRAAGTEVSVTTTAPHNFLVGQNVEIQTGMTFSDVDQFLNGPQIISAVTSPTSFKYFKASNSDIPQTVMGAATATVGSETAHVTLREIDGNVVTLTTAETTEFGIGDSVTVVNVTPTMKIVEKSLDAANSKATITTEMPHELAVGDSVQIHGIRDLSTLSKRSVSGTTVTFTTDIAHNFSAGDEVVISDLNDVSRIVNKQLTSDVVTLTTAVPHNISVGDEVTVSGIYDTHTITAKTLIDDVATVNFVPMNNFPINSEVVISDVIDVASVVSKAAENGVATLIFNRPHNFLETEKITVAGVGAPFNGEFTVLSFTDDAIQYEIELEDTIVPVTSGGTVTGSQSIFNAEATVSFDWENAVDYQRAGNDVPFTPTDDGTIRGWSFLNGTFEVTAVTANTFQYALVGNNIPSTPIPLPDSEEQLPAQAEIPSIHLGTRTLTGVTRNTIKFTQSGITNAVALEPVSGVVSTPSIFNGTRTITAVTSNDFNFALSGTSNILETSVNSLSYVKAPGVFNGTYTITDVDTNNNTLSYARTHPDMTATKVVGYGSAVVTPLAVVSSFGPYPGNADIGIGFSTMKYSGVDVEPIPYRSFELVNVGEALDKYSDAVEGFEFRIDCDFDQDSESFSRTLVLIPIDFPNPPAPGEVSPLSRFGADKLVFEYPKNISNLSIEESAENSATRFFAIGESDLGPGAGPPFSVASSETLLRGGPGKRRWPLLDDDEKISDVDNEEVLYTYARKYLSESRPPDSKLTVSVIGSLEPLVGTYHPGDWCSLIVKDSFILQRLKSGLEPRDDVMVRKIESIKVTVPDGTTFPEQVDLVLIPEWEVDKRGE